MNTNTHKKTFALTHKRQSGLTLVELLIALIVGIIVIGIAFFGFRANQISYQNKVQLDTVHEAARYTAYTITRLVRNADSLTVVNDELVITANDAVTGVLDCLGQQVSSGTGNLGRLGVTNDNILYCNNSSTNQFVEGVQSITFTPYRLNMFGQRIGPTGVLCLDEEEDEENCTLEEFYWVPGDWGPADGAFVEMVLVGGLEVEFVTTMRNKVLFKQQ